MLETARYPFPKVVEPFMGEIVDIDGHEHIPPNHWESEFGSITNRLREAAGASTLPAAGCVENDDAEINTETVFRRKYSDACGAWDMQRRLQVMDFVGIRRSIMFPGIMAQFASALYTEHDRPDLFASITGDRRTYARQLIGTYNDWCIRTARLDDRLRPVAILGMDDFDDVLGEARRCIDAGVRAFWFPTSKPLAGMSPADPRLDPLWSLMQSAKVPVAMHVDADIRFLGTSVWRDAPAFHGWKVGNEFQLDPWTLGTLHLSTENFLSCMILGGVFERFPSLAFGAAEVCGHWVGPLAERMDLWHANARKFLQEGGSSPLTMKPSDYIRRNVRVSPFDIEDVAGYIDKYGLEEVYCFSADYPHVEGGTKPIEDFTANIERLGPDILRKFFVDNGRLLLPD